MIDHILFDFDGVIANSDVFNWEAFTFIFAPYGIPFSQDIYEIYFSGKSFSKGIESYLQELGKPELFKEIYEKKRSYDPNYSQFVSLYADTKECIDSLKSSYTFSIVTGARQEVVTSFLVMHNLLSLFPIIVSCEMYSNGKPDPEPYHKALHLIGKSSSSVVVIEDTPAGVISAMSAGISCIAVTHTHPASSLTQASWVVPSLFSHDIAHIFHPASVGTLPTA